LICNTMYEQPLEMGGLWVANRLQIIKRYMTTPWFYIDLVAVMPFYAVGWAMDASSPASESEVGSDLASVRLVKLLRMLRLARVLKASRVLKRHVMDALMGYLEFTYSSLQTVGLFVGLIFYAHLQACFYALISSFLAPCGLATRTRGPRRQDRAGGRRRYAAFTRRGLEFPLSQSNVDLDVRRGAQCDVLWAHRRGPCAPRAVGAVHGVLLLVVHDGHRHRLWRDAARQLGGASNVFDLHAALGDRVGIHPLDSGGYCRDAQPQQRPLPHDDVRPSPELTQTPALHPKLSPCPEPKSDPTSFATMRAPALTLAALGSARSTPQGPAEHFYARAFAAQAAAS
jgi:hypothetical protein